MDIKYMPQQQQQTKLKPIQPQKIGGTGNIIGKAMGKLAGNGMKMKTAIKPGKSAMSKAVGKMTKKKSLPSYQKVSNSVRKTMGY